MQQISRTLIILVSIGLAIIQAYAQSSCGKTTASLTEPNGTVTLCTNGSDSALLSYNITDNTSSLPNYAYVVEGPNGLAFLEDGDPSINIIPAEFGAINGDTLCVSGFAYDVAEINGLISTLSNSLVCVLAGFDAATCQIIADLNAQGGLSSLNDALDFAITLGAIPPATTEEAIILLTDVDTQAAALGGVCFAASNNGAGKDYCYVIENCCPAQDVVSLSNNISSASNYVAETAVCLDIGFDVTTHFYATIENCP